MNASHVYYVKAGNYGEAGQHGRTIDGKPLDHHAGGIMLCPRDDCGAPMTVGQEQIEHIGSPCSVGHMSHKYRVMHALDGPPFGPNVKCGAHFVTGDPEETVPTSAWPQDLAWLLDTFGGPRQVYRRPITWHGDV